MSENVPSPPIFEPCRPAFPELVTFAVPRGGRERLKDRAREEGTSVSALVRQAVERAFGGQDRTVESAR